MFNENLWQNTTASIELATKTRWLYRMTCLPSFVEDVSDHGQQHFEREFSLLPQFEQVRPEGQSLIHSLHICRQTSQSWKHLSNIVHLYHFPHSWLSYFAFCWAKVFFLRLKAVYFLSRTFTWHPYFFWQPKLIRRLGCGMYYAPNFFNLFFMLLMWHSTVHLRTNKQTWSHSEYLFEVCVYGLELDAQSGIRSYGHTPLPRHGHYGTSIVLRDRLQQKIRYKRSELYESSIAYHVIAIKRTY